MVHFSLAHVNFRLCIDSCVFKAESRVISRDLRRVGIHFDQSSRPDLGLNWNESVQHYRHERIVAMTEPSMS